MAVYVRIENDNFTHGTITVFTLHVRFFFFFERNNGRNDKYHCIQKTSGTLIYNFYAFKQ